MNHLATIQSEFLKEARKWDDLSYEEQQGYIKRHPKTKRKITARPEQKSIEIGEADTDEIKLTKIQKKVFDACEPLIKRLQNQAVEHYDNILQRFEDQKKQAPNEQSEKFIRNFAGQNTDILYFLNSVYEKIDKNLLYRTLDNLKISSDRKQRYYDNMKDEIKNYNTYKLSKALQRDITSDFDDIKNIRITTGDNGFEISANLTDNQDRQWSFNTKAISAGGYNIQVWHYRYIINLSSPEVPREEVRRRISEQEKQEKEIKRQERSKQHQERTQLKSAKKIVSVFMEIKNKIKNWDEWEKSNLLQYIAEGKRSQNELDETEKDINRFRDFINRHGSKRQQLMEKVQNGQIKMSTFDEIGDLMTKYRHNFWHYDTLKSQQQRGELL